MSSYATALLTRPRRSSGLLAILQVIASTVTTVLTFAVVMLASAFWRIPNAPGGYRVLAVALVVLLVVPLITLGTASGRLSARSRDDRLATLRLLGLSASRVRTLAVTETMLVAGIGIVIGSALAAGLPFTLSLLSVAGIRLDAATLWLPVWLSSSLPVLLLLVASLSALLGLQKVVLSPLGVRTRTDAPKLNWVRLVVAAAAIVGSVIVLQIASPGWGTIGLVIAFAIVILIVMGVLGVAGPFVIGLIARRRVSSTSDAAMLIAARRNLESPKGAWRQVSAVALTSFLLVPAGSMLGFLHAVQNSSSVLTPADILLFQDARTMLIALVVVSFIVVMCQISITQAAAILERRDLYVALDQIGMPLTTINIARRKQVMAPAFVAVLGSAATAAVLTFTLLVVALTNSPLFVLVTLATLALGTALVRAGVMITNPVLDKVLAEPDRLAQ